MGLMDGMSDKADEKMRDRYEQLKTEAQNGDLTDERREEFERLRTHFEKR